MLATKSSRPKSALLLSLLVSVFLLDLVFIYFNLNGSRLYSKTLLVPMLIFIYVNELKIKRRSLNKLFLLGLVFSFLGDLFLLFSWGFLPGLGAFLLAHVCYIFCFIPFAQGKISWKIAFQIVCYTFTLVAVLFPYLNGMEVPVLFYAAAIATMFFFCIRSKNRKLVVGAFLFVISDSILAVNLFVFNHLFLDLAVMLTYVPAQYFLIQGVVQLSGDRVDG